MYVNVTPERCSGLLDFSYNYLLSYVYFSFGMSLEIKNTITSKSREIVMRGRSCGVSGCKTTDVIWV
uniref:Uncharacterized protein n=1 Tax=Solanum lycopersicum TaxID=4081 RepID=A0A3Q7GGQ2_SOLLC